ncbi:MAG: type II toxin-antitoxin system PemK/MazF family toxin [Nitrososphaerota archaeon]|nr:type II toxin-antitoxin system PemK/MazF family toxin [Candidatus Brockarchaeota archaeon]
MKGKIVLVPFPFTDLTAVKLRPALVLFEGERDVVVAFISSRIPGELKPTDVLIEETHPEFKLTGLKTSSVIKLDKIATLLKSMVMGEIGEIGPQIKREINEKLIKTYSL